MENIDYIQSLIERLERVKEQQIILATQEIACKEALMDVMKEEGLEKKESAHGTVRIQRRAEKEYNVFIKGMETELKAAKKLADDMGDYQTLGFKESLVYMPPKELF